MARLVDSDDDSIMNEIDRSGYDRSNQLGTSPTTTNVGRSKNKIINDTIDSLLPKVAPGKTVYNARRDTKNKGHDKPLIVNTTAPVQQLPVPEKPKPELATPQKTLTLDKPVRTVAEIQAAEASKISEPDVKKEESVTSLKPESHEAHPAPKKAFKREGEQQLTYYDLERILNEVQMVIDLRDYAIGDNKEKVKAVENLNLNEYYQVAKKLPQLTRDSMKKLLENYIGDGQFIHHAEAGLFVLLLDINDVAVKGMEQALNDVKSDIKSTREHQDVIYDVPLPNTDKKKELVQDIRKLSGHLDAKEREAKLLNSAVARAEADRLRSEIDRKAKSLLAEKNIAQSNFDNMVTRVVRMTEIRFIAWVMKANVDKAVLSIIAEKRWGKNWQTGDMSLDKYAAYCVFNKVHVVQFLMTLLNLMPKLKEQLYVYDIDQFMCDHFGLTTETLIVIRACEARLHNKKVHALNGNTTYNNSKRIYLKKATPVTLRHSDPEDTQPVLVNLPVKPHLDALTVNPLVNNLIRPNPHIGKLVLDQHEVQEVLAWALSLAGNARGAQALSEAAEINVGGTNPFLGALIDLVSTTLYGPNNYIGPLKTGVITEVKPLGDILLSMPATTAADTEARAHDVALTLGAGAKAHDILTDPLMRAAQIAYPLFETVPDPGMSNYDLLLQQGIEPNPGPKEYTFENANMLDIITEIISNPSSTTSYLNTAMQNAYNDEFAYSMRWGDVTLRSALDDRTDKAQASSGWASISGAVFDLAADRARSLYRGFGAMLQNRHGRSLSWGDLGLGIDSTLHEFASFLAGQRTARNMANGDNWQHVYERVSQLDYGCYLPCAKLLLYGFWTQYLVSDESTSDRYDTETIWRATNINTNPTHIYPRSLNAAPGTLQIMAGFITQTQYAQYLRNDIDIVIGGVNLNLNDQLSIAAIPYTGTSIPAWAWTLIALCYMESPFFSGDNVPLEYRFITNVAPYFGTSFNGTLAQPAMNKTRLPGAREYLLFVKTSDTPDAITISSDATGAVTAVIANLPNGIGPGVDIAPVLEAYCARNLTNWTSVPYGWREAFDYFAKTMDMSDWTAACIIAAMCSKIKCPPRPYGFSFNTVDGGGIFGDTTVSPLPSVDISLIVTNISAATQTQIDALTFKRVHFNCLGIHDYLLGTQNAAGTANNPPPQQFEVQNSPLIVQYALQISMLTKDSIFGTNIGSVTKANLRPIYYMIGELAKALIQLPAHFFQDEGITYRMMFSSGVAVTDVRTTTWSKLASNWHNLFEQLVGFRFMSLLDDVLDPLDTYTNVPNYWSAGTVLDSPIILHQDLFDKEPDGYYPIKLQPQVYLSEYKTTWQNSAMAVSNIAGINVGGALTTVSAHSYDKDTQQFTRDFQLLYAQAMTQHGLNPAVANRLLDVFIVNENNSLLMLKRPIYNLMKQWLTWASNDTPVDVFNAGQRQGLVVFLPYYPPSFDNQFGVRYRIMTQSQQVWTVPRGCLSLNGSGSSSSQFVERAGMKYIERMKLKAQSAIKPLTLINNPADKTQPPGDTDPGGVKVDVSVAKGKI